MSLYNQLNEACRKKHAVVRGIINPKRQRFKINSLDNCGDSSDVDKVYDCLRRFITAS